MTDDLDKRLARIADLVVQLRTAQARGYELLEKIDEVLKAEPSTVNYIKRLFAVWGAKWQQRYRGPYVWNRGKDAAIFKRLLKGLPVEEVEHRMERFLASDDPFYLKTRHSLGCFASAINSLGAAPREIGFVPHDCHHEPPCASDQLHTARYLREAKEQSF